MTDVNHGLDQKIRLAREATDSNGLGTAFYLFGLVEDPRAIDVFNVEHLLRQIRPTKNSARGCLMIAYGNHGDSRSLRDIEVAHAAIVTSTHPLRVIHRPGPNRPLIENVTPSRAFRDYNSQGYIISCFVKR